MLKGFYLRLAGEMDRRVNRRINALTDRLLGDLAPGVTDLLPGYVSLYVEYDSRRVSERRLRGWLERHLKDAGSRDPGRIVEIPVRYDGEDLADVAELTGLTTDEIALRHSATEYHVYAMGFAPGFPFMGEVTPELRVPRLPAPRKQVPAHSVGIAGAQTGIYPRSTAGGWRLLGRALEAVYDPHREEPFLLTAGDRVKFTSVRGETPAEPEPVELLPPQPRVPFLHVLEPGLLDLVVDGGRELVGRFGLARGGPLDRRSAQLANALVGNSNDKPLIELNLRGPVLEAVGEGVIAFAGWGLAPAVNGAEQEPFRSLLLRRGDVITFAKTGRWGCRGYLAIAGGVEASSFAGSSSVDLKGLIGRPLTSSDVVGRGAEARARPGFQFTPYGFSRDRTGPLRLRILPGPQASDQATEALIAAPFVVSAADRVGVRLEGADVPGGEIVSEGVPLGAIQVPSGGAPIILLNDRGTLGGYAKPALVHPADLPLAGQLNSGDEVRFIRSQP